MNNIFQIFYQNSIHSKTKIVKFQYVFKIQYFHFLIANSKFLMHRSKSDTSLLTMYKEENSFGNMDFNPYDSDTWQDDGMPIIIPDAQPLPPGARGIVNLPSGDEYSESETYSEYPEPVTQTDPTEQTIHITDLSNCREVLATLSNFTSGQIGQYLKSHQGLLILPLHAVSIFRLPHGHHTGNYPVLIYYPKKDLSRYPHLENFNEAVNVLYQNQ